LDEHGKDRRDRFLTGAGEKGRRLRGRRHRSVDADERQ
jgi:hypothetical protein